MKTDIGEPAVQRTEHEIVSAATHTKSASRLSAFIKENGWFLFFCKVLGRLIRAPRNLLVGRRLGTKGFRAGRSLKILGLGHIRIGARFAAGDFLWLEAVTRYAAQQFHPAIQIGDNVGVGDSVHIGCTTSVRIGDGVLIGSRVTIIDHNHGVYRGTLSSLPAVAPSERDLSIDTPISIGSKVWIGDGAVILPGSQIGDGSIIGANAVVTGAIPEACIAAGSPARPIRKFDPQSGRWLEWQNNQ